MPSARDFAVRAMFQNTLLWCALTVLANCWRTNAFVFSAGRSVDAPLSNMPIDAFLIRRGRATSPLRMAAEEEEWHPMDPAYTTPQLLAALWHVIAQSSDMVKGESMTVTFPRMLDQFSPSYLSRLMAHFDACKDVCDYFGTKIVLLPYKDKLGQMVGFTVKSYRNPEDKEDEFEFAYDPMWDDGVDFDYTGIDDEYDDGDGGEQKNQIPEIENKIPGDDDEIIDISKKWVDKVMSDMGICPFTSGPDMAGMPMGKVFYCVDRASTMESVYDRYWNEVVRVEQVDEKELSTTLLIVPEFCMDNVELFENFANTLTQPLETLEVEDLLQLVFFHKDWTFRDGAARSGMGAAANYARRSPWPMINILRTNQVRAAQKGIPTGLVYKQNEKTLNLVGAEKLEAMLRLRNWEDIDIKVNRKDMEALRIAMDLKETGEVALEDRSVIHDATPAANKVPDEQAEGSNMVNVILQALDKRLGKTADGSTTEPLNGPETSAAIMASDFLLKALEDVAQGNRAPDLPMEKPSIAQSQTKEPVAGGAALVEDLEDLSATKENDELSVLFGGQGIMKSIDEDDEPSIDTRSFY